MSALLLLRAVAAARLLAVAHALGVQGAADDLVADPRQVAHPAAAHQHDRVLLQVRGRGLGNLVLAALAYQLLDSGHRVSVFLLLAPWRDVPGRGPRPAARRSWPCYVHGLAISRASSDALDLLISVPPRPPWSG